MIHKLKAMWFSFGHTHIVYPRGQLRMCDLFGIIYVTAEQILRTGDAIYIVDDGTARRAQ